MYNTTKSLLILEHRLSTADCGPLRIGFERRRNAQIVENKMYNKSIFVLFHFRMKHW